MKRLLFVFTLTGLTALLVMGCSTLGNLVGSGPIVEKAYQFADFTQIEVTHDFEFDISRSETFKVAVSIHENLVDSLDVSQSGQTLKVRLKPGNIANSDAKVTITLPELERLEVSGAARGNVTGFKSSRDFNLQVSGASQTNIDIEAGKTKIDISGASRLSGHLKAADTQMVVTGASHCELIGSADMTRLEISGASSANIPDLILQNADVELSGASSATINTSGKLDLDLSGASTLNYFGKPQLGKTDISGASKIHSK
jgi:hypothetical protein